MGRIVQLSEDVSAVIQLVEIDERISWVPPGVSGFEPFNTYLVDGEDTLLVIDPGMVVHWPFIHDTIAERLGGRQLVVFNTRSELDCIASLGRVLDSFDRVQTVTSCPLNPMDLAHRKVPSRMQPPSAYVGFGDTLGDFGFPHIHSLRPVIKMLGTAWLYDASGRILFSTDCFGGDYLSGPEDAPIRRTLAGAPPGAQLRAAMLAKFDWLAKADAPMLQELWSALFEGLDIEILAPTHGRIQAGKDVVDTVLETYRKVLLEHDVPAH